MVSGFDFGQESNPGYRNILTFTPTVVMTNRQWRYPQYSVSIHIEKITRIYNIIHHTKIIGFIMQRNYAAKLYGFHAAKLTALLCSEIICFFMQQSVYVFHAAKLYVFSCSKVYTFFMRRNYTLPADFSQEK